MDWNGRWRTVHALHFHQESHSHAELGAFASSCVLLFVLCHVCVFGREEEQFMCRTASQRSSFTAPSREIQPLQVFVVTL